MMTLLLLRHQPRRLVSRPGLCHPRHKLAALPPPTQMPPLLPVLPKSVPAHKNGNGSLKSVRRRRGDRARGDRTYTSCELVSEFGTRLQALHVRDAATNTICGGLSTAETLWAGLYGPTIYAQQRARAPALRCSLEQLFTTDTRNTAGYAALAGR
jgi:hypothetical protein